MQKFEKIIVQQIIKIFPAFLKSKSSLPYFQDLATGQNFKRHECGQYPHSIFLSSTFQYYTHIYTDVS